MDFETFFQSLFAFIKNSDNVYYVLYAAATCLLTQIFKKIFVNKVKVDVLHKFDWAVVLPFVFGVAFAAVDLVFVRKTPISVAFFVKLVVDAATIGALASVIFKLISACGESLSSLQKNKLFAMFYTQLLYFGTARTQLLEKQLSLKDFIQQVKIVAQNAEKIYQTEDTDAVKKDKLFRLMDGLVDRESISACLEVLDKALSTAVKTD